MEFFDKLGKKASEAYKATAEKTNKLTKEAKIKMKIAENKSAINELYQEIGKKVYEKHVREENIDIKKDLEEECAKIDVLSDEIEASLKQSLDLKDMKQCESCNKQIEKEAKFCPECGAKQEEIEAKEVEVLEKLESEEIEPDNENEKEIVVEELESEAEKKED